MTTRVDIDRMLELVADGAIVVDVLPKKTFEQVHVPGARSIPFETFSPADVDGLDRDVPVVLYCFDQH